jgi:hypothetical protein
MDALCGIKEKLNLPFAVEIIMLGAWAIWIITNRRIFEGQTPSLQAWRILYKQELQLLSYIMKKKLDVPFQTWLDQLFKFSRIA